MQFKTLLIRLHHKTQDNEHTKDHCGSPVISSWCSCISPKSYYSSLHGLLAPTAIIFMDSHLLPPRPQSSSFLISSIPLCGDIILCSSHIYWRTHRIENQLPNGFALDAAAAGCSSRCCLMRARHLGQRPPSNPTLTTMSRISFGTADCLRL